MCQFYFLIKDLIMCLQKWNNFHDWNISGFKIGEEALTLSVFIGSSKKEIYFKGVSRCYVGDFLMQNVIYEVKIYDRATSPSDYLNEYEFLSKFSSSKLDRRKIARLSPSVGAHAVIEFEDFFVLDP